MWATQPIHIPTLKFYFNLEDMKRTLIIILILLNNYSCLGTPQDGEKQSGRDGAEAERPEEKTVVAGFLKYLDHVVDPQADYSDNKIYTIYRNIGDYALQVIPYYTFDQDKLSKKGTEQDIMDILFLPDDEIALLGQGKGNDIFLAILKPEDDGVWYPSSIIPYFGEGTRWLQGVLDEAAATEWTMFHCFSTIYFAIYDGKQYRFFTYLGKEVGAGGIYSKVNDIKEATRSGGGHVIF